MIRKWKRGVWLLLIAFAVAGGAMLYMQRIETAKAAAPPSVPGE